MRGRSCYRFAQVGVFADELTYLNGLPTFEKQGLDIIDRRNLSKAEKWAKSAVKDLPLIPGKIVPFSNKPEDQVAHGEALTKAGLGGKSKNGKEYWINDEKENIHGWGDSAEARGDRQLAAYLRLLQPMVAVLAAAKNKK